MKEHPIQQRILLACGRGLTRLFRQNVGKGWIGDAIRLKNGDVLIRDARPFIAGVPGMADLGGWKTVTVTADMVGRQLAVYVAIEVKQPGGRARPEQQVFLDAVRSAGGLAGVARSEAEAAAILADERS
jgi:hypothetical protein